MTCRCGRDNDARRCYCGACGRRIGKACERCHFVNSVDDSFCGGCGEATLAAKPAVVKPLAVATAPAVATPPAAAKAPAIAAAPSPDRMSAAELASLLGKGAANTQAPLPAHVSQDDLDRLFEGAS